MAQLKQKVTLKKKKEVVTIPIKAKSKLWLWLLLLALVIVVIVSFLFKTYSSEGNSMAVQTEKSAVEHTVRVVTPGQTPIDGSIKQENSTTENHATIIPNNEPAKKTKKASTLKTATAYDKSSQSAVKPYVSNKPSFITPQGTLEEKALRVIRGDFGNGADRKKALGSEYNEIQQKVNEMYSNRDF